jgi:hypothetical protein
MSIAVHHLGRWCQGDPVPGARWATSRRGVRALSEVYVPGGSGPPDVERIQHLTPGGRGSPRHLTACRSIRQTSNPDWRIRPKAARSCPVTVDQTHRWHGAQPRQSDRTGPVLVGSVATIMRASGRRQPVGSPGGPGRPTARSPSELHPRRRCPRTPSGVICSSFIHRPGAATRAAHRSAGTRPGAVRSSGTGTSR